tara:strand:+ start:24356 stop:24580 length:225 start_codon:yes stop_codon:yes gene_type:complete
MSDYFFDAQMLRGEMANKLSSNTEQFVWVITNAMTDVDINEAIDGGQLGDEANSKMAVQNLRAIADAIEAGQIT